MDVCQCELLNCSCGKYSYIYFTKENANESSVSKEAQNMKLIRETIFLNNSHNDALVNFY